MNNDTSNTSAKTSMNANAASDEFDSEKSSKDKKYPSGFADPSNPYNTLYNNILETVREQHRTNGRHSAEDIASALTLAAANAKFDPKSDPQIVTSTKNPAVLIAVEPSARPSVDATHRLAIVDTDAANIKPTAEQIEIVSKKRVTIDEGGFVPPDRGPAPPSSGSSTR
jgi:hypothetical protein